MFRLQRLLLRLNVNLEFAAVLVLRALLAHDFSGAFMRELLCLQLFALEVKKTEGIFLPGLGRNH